MPSSQSTIKSFYVQGLQVPCILGMDFMTKFIIDKQAGKIKVEPPLHSSFKKNTTRLLRLEKEVTIKPREVQVIGECDSPFDIALRATQIYI